MRRVALTVLLAAAVAGSACLKTEVTHVLYLSPSGALTWSVHDRDVHSDDQDRARRIQEEFEFVRAVEQRTHAPLVALETLGGREGTSALTRAHRPWEALTSARFDGAESLVAALLRELGIDGRARQLVSGDRVTLTVEWTADGAVDEESAVLALVGELEAYRIVLTEGRFVAAEGFRISPDGRTATPVEQSGVPGARWRVSLTWESAPSEGR